MRCLDCIHFLRHIRPHCFVTPVIVDEDSDICKNFKMKDIEDGYQEEKAQIKLV